MADSEHDSEFEEVFCMPTDFSYNDDWEEEELEPLLELSSSLLLF